MLIGDTSGDAEGVVLRQERFEAIDDAVLFPEQCITGDARLLELHVAARILIGEGAQATLDPVARYTIDRYRLDV